MTSGRADRVVWVLTALVAGLCLQTLYRQPIGWIGGGLAALLAVLAALRPVDATLVLASLTPLSTVLLVATGSNVYGIAFAESLVLAYITGSSARRAFTGGRLDVPGGLRWAAVLLLVAAGGSALIQASVFRAEQPDQMVGGLVPSFLIDDYVIRRNPMSPAIQFMEGLLILLIVADLAARERRVHDQVLRMLAIGASGAAVFSLLRLVTAAMARPDPWATFAEYFLNVRVNVHHGDLNGAGSYYALMLFVALAVAARARALGIATGVLAAAGLWMAGSRTAIAAMFLTLGCAGGLALVRRGWRKNVPVLAGLVLLATAAYGLWLQYPQMRNRGAPAWSLTTRLDLTQAGLQMAASAPLFGVGVGRYYDLSDQYVGDMLARQGKLRENAHNYFVQVLAELGVPGLALFLWVVVCVLGGAWRQSAWGLAAGLFAFLLTCVGGHPLLMPIVACPFWVAAGLAAAASSDAPVEGRFVRLAGWLMLALFIASLPLRTIAAVRQANLGQVSTGLSVWQQQPDGSRFRWAGGRVTFYVPSSAWAIKIPLRIGQSDLDAIEVQVLLDGREADRVVLRSGEDWRMARLVPFRRVPTPFSRIDLMARRPGASDALAVRPTNTSGLLMVGRPVLEQ